MNFDRQNIINASEEIKYVLKKSVENIAFDQVTRLLYSTDASIYQLLPIGVVFPCNIEEVIAVVEIANAHQIPLLPRGGGSSLAGQAIGHALILDFSRHMDNMIEINKELNSVRTQPGITLGTLNKVVSKHGLMFGPDPASGDRATIGGILGNNSAGAHSIIHGMTHDHVLATEVVLSDASRVLFNEIDGDWKDNSNRSGILGALYRGIPTILDQYASEIATRYPNTFRHVAGYNLHLLSKGIKLNISSLIVGSEGTLGIITEAELKLVAIPKAKRLAMVHFSDLRTAMEAVPYLVETQPTAIEVLDKMLFDLTRDKVEYRRLLTFVEGNPEIVLLVEYCGESEHQLDSFLVKMRKTLRKIHHNEPVVVISDKKEQANVWYVRKVGLGILMSIRGDAKPIPFIEDAAVPVEHLADYITEIFNFSLSTGVEQVAMYAHASVGCMHVRPLVNIKTKDGIRHLRQIAEKSVELVIKYGGTTSGEHGEGIVRGEFSKHLFGERLVNAFQEVKNLFDPKNILNPGKVVNVPKMDDETLLRFGPNYALPYKLDKTVFDFSSDHGFSGAVEMCNGAGVCRKIGDGVMCPSFQVTRDEKHSTRGRANALRSAMMGYLGSNGMATQELYDVLDLCLSCHACKSECPSSVDMTMLKAEFLNYYYGQHGIPLRAWFFGNLEHFLKVGQTLTPLSNLFLRLVMKPLFSVLGIHTKRVFPLLAQETFSRWFKNNNSYRRITERSKHEKVVFFHDTFVEYVNPNIGKAAVKILEYVGYEPIVLMNKRDSGRSAVSKGLLGNAQKMARHNLSLLAPYAHKGIPIIGCEPSSVVMLIEEYRLLFPGLDADTVAERTMMIEQFLLDENLCKEFSFDNKPRKVLYHGHCQQKAFFGTDATIKVLKKIPNCRVEEIESGCCGMAGSFGYEKEHYDLSIQLAEMSLAPTIRSADEDVIICATGMSCRDQIEHTTGRVAVHPIEIFADSIKYDR